MHNVDLIRMQVEFYQDEFGVLQLYHADKIWVRMRESQYKQNIPNLEEQPNKDDQDPRSKLQNFTDMQVSAKEIRAFRKYKFLKLID